MKNQSVGKVVGIKNQVVEVEFELEMPKIHDLLTLEENNRAVLEVIASSSLSKFFCLSLSNVNLLQHPSNLNYMLNCLGKHFRLICALL